MDLHVGCICMDPSEIEQKIGHIIEEIPEIDSFVVYRVNGSIVATYELNTDNSELIVNESLKIVRQSHKFLINLKKGKISDLSINSEYGIVLIMGQSGFGATIILNTEGKSHFALARKRIRKLLKDISVH